jgi:hypothetical protein
MLAVRGVEGVISGPEDIVSIRQGCDVAIDCIEQGEAATRRVAFQMGLVARASVSLPPGGT